MFNNFIWMWGQFSKPEFIYLFLLYLFSLCLAYKISKKFYFGLGDSINVWLFGILWTLVCTGQYWILGRGSVLGHSDEQTAGIPWLYYLTHYYNQGPYAFEWSGGSDALIGMVFATQYLSIERMLFFIFPLSIAILVMKAGTIAISFSGGYVVSRCANLNKENSILVGMLAGVGSILNIGWALCGNGWGFALLPWIFYILVLRTKSNYYYISCVLVSILFSSSTALFHQLPLTYVAIALGIILFPPARYMRFTIGALILGVVSVLNWAEVIEAIIQFSSISARSTTAPVLQNSMLFLIGEKTRALMDVMVVPVGIFSISVLFIKKSSNFISAILVYVVSVTIGFSVGKIDWGNLNIPLLSGYRWELLSYGNSFVILLILICSLWTFNWEGKSAESNRLSSFSRIYLVIIVLVAITAHTLDDIERYKDLGGQEHFIGTKVLDDKSWRNKGIYRATTLSRTLTPNMLNAYGFETFDGVSNSFLIRSDYYFGLAVNNPPKILKNKSYHWLSTPNDGELSSSVNINALAIANVRYLITDHQFIDSQLQLVASSEDGSFNPHRVYEIKNVWPRVFIPKKISFSADNLNNQKFYDQILIQENEGVVVSADDRSFIDDQRVDVSLCVLNSFERVSDGFDIEINCKFKGGAVGMVVVNMPYLEFWTAYSNEKKLKIVPVNGVQMGLLIPTNEKYISLRYARTN